MKYDLGNDYDLSKFKHKVNNLIDNKKKVDIKSIGSARSINLNSYLHVVISLFAIEYGYTLAEAKTLLKRECGFMVYEKNGQRFLVQTSKQNNEECSKFVEWIRNYSSQQGLYIPDADEYKQNKFSIDKEIDKHKTYL